MRHNIKCIALCTLFSIVFCMTSCGKTPQNPDTDTEVQLPPFVEDSDGDLLLEDAAPPPEDIEVEAEAPTAIHLMKGSLYESEWNEAYGQTLATAVYPHIQPEGCCAKDYLELAGALAEISEAKQTAVMKEYEELIQAAEVEVQEYPEDFSTYEIEENVSARRADTKVVSLLFDGYYFSGGIHGATYYESENIDAATGDSLELSDVVNDVNVLPELIKAQFEKTGATQEFYPDLDLAEYITENLQALTWVLDYTGITFYFDPYEIAPYASGVQVAALSFAEHPDLVKEEYQAVPDSYGVELSEYSPYYYDINGDGVADELTVHGRVSEYDRLDAHVITINGMSMESPTDGYHIDPMFIHTADGKNYLYIQDTSDNDWCILNVYDLSDGYVEKVGGMSVGWYTTYIEEADYLVLEQVLTDPKEFRLDTRTDVLSTVSGYKNYQIDESGMPVSQDEWYHIENELHFTLNQSLRADVIDESTGEVTGETTVESGASVSYYRTDNDRMADLKLFDGKVVRVWLDNAEWPRCVEGVSIEELFDGLIFAG